MKVVVVLILMSLLAVAGHAQMYEVKSFSPTSSTFRYLMKSNDFISRNDSINELILDLSDPFVVDSIISRKKQHHKVGGFGIFAHMFGYNWRAFSMNKEKMVGTIYWHGRSSKEQFSEYDINFNLYFSLPKYQQRLLQMYDFQKELDRQDIRKDHKINYDEPPFVRDSGKYEIEKYRLHCEVTPEDDFRALLHEHFYPTLPGKGGMQKHKNFESKRTSAGFYGVLCQDCNHSCWAEMHPYEWMWWMKCLDGDSTLTREWHVGLFHEGSNRMKKWSDNPKVGSINIPFVFDINDIPQIEIYREVNGEFETEYLNQLPTDDQYLQNDKDTLRGFEIQLEEKVIHLPVMMMDGRFLGGVKYWLSDLNFDPDANLLSGFLNISVSVNDVHTCTIRFVQ